MMERLSVGSRFVCASAESIHSASVAVSVSCPRHIARACRAVSNASRSGCQCFRGKATFFEHLSRCRLGFEVLAAANLLFASIQHFEPDTQLRRDADLASYRRVRCIDCPLHGRQSVKRIARQDFIVSKERREEVPGFGTALADLRPTYPDLVIPPV